MTAIPLDVLPLLTEYNVGPLAVTRQGSRVKSASVVYGPGPTTTITLAKVAAHPLTGHDLIQHSEADRVAGLQRFYTAQKLLAADAASDVITYDGQRWRVVKVHRYGDTGEVWIVDAVRMESGVP